MVKATVKKMFNLYIYTYLIYLILQYSQLRICHNIGFLLDSNNNNIIAVSTELFLNK